MAKATIKSITDIFAKVSELDIKDFDGTSVGVKLKMVGTDSKQYRDAEKKMLPFAGKKITDLSSDDIEKIAALKKEMAISFIVGWDNEEVMGAPYSPEFAQQLFSREEASFILGQVEEFAQERANFFRPNKK
ncbi:hypothetical protein [Sapientia aquatica]|uniref:Uncharacterized protein n=1 Tax=Sapientia aquatica TaxID=1549640 RepID=A0A4R5VYJ5_9BURK|nr:hypothetical protein [Sapientia aquatica]TDK63552.1 hypothetical protein E2I14_15235 [Sapientia aquatica]